MVKRTLAPDLATFLSMSHKMTALKLSKPDVGSSKKTRAGLDTSSTPTEVRLRSPPEMPLIRAPPINVSLQSMRPNSASIRSAMTSISSSDVNFGNLSFAENRIASRGVCVTSSESSCATKATFFRTSMSVGST